MVLSSIKSIGAARASSSAKVSGGVFSSLEKSIQSWINGWPAQTSNTDILRASGLHGVCPREFVLNYWDPKPNKKFDWTSQIRMSMGTHLHSYIQNYILGPMGVLYGNWDRVKDGWVQETIRGVHPDPELSLDEIAHQRPLTWIYSEDTVSDEDYRITGHLDGWVDLDRVGWLDKNFSYARKNPKEASKKLFEMPKGEMILFELKTTGKYIMENLTGPEDIPDYYKIQAVAYQNMTKCHRTLFWYMERDSLKSKMMVYEYDSSWWKEVTKKASVIWRSIRDRELPDSFMACKLPTDKRAKQCVHSERCWSRRLDFKAFVERCVEEQPDRKWLDLSEFSL